MVSRRRRRSAGTIQRVPSQTLAAFDGTLDYLGAERRHPAVDVARRGDGRGVEHRSRRPRGVHAAAPSRFHVATTIGETFSGGGGNVEAQINTFASASVRVCYRYALADAAAHEPATTVGGRHRHGTAAARSSAPARLRAANVHGLTAAAGSVLRIAESGHVLTSWFASRRLTLHHRIAGDRGQVAESSGQTLRTAVTAQPHRGAEPAG